MNGNSYLDITFVATCFNEEKNIESWCESFLAMSHLPREIVIIDACSKDNTVELLRKFLFRYDGEVRIFEVACNISKGRNLGVAYASFEKIAISDFGVTFSKHWLGEIYVTLGKCDCASGVYELAGSSKYQVAYKNLYDLKIENLISTVFEPSSRSFGIKKKIFAKMDGYDENLLIGEDTEFVKRLRKGGATFGLAKNALVRWDTRQNLREILLQHYRYSYWDGKIGQNWGRIKHQIFLIFLICLPLIGSYFGIVGFFLGSLFFMIAIWIKASANTKKRKNRYAKVLETWLYLQILIVSSTAFATGLFSKFTKPTFREEN